MISAKKFHSRPTIETAGLQYERLAEFRTFKSWPELNYYQAPIPG